MREGGGNDSLARSLARSPRPQISRGLPPLPLFLFHVSAFHLAGNHESLDVLVQQQQLPRQLVSITSVYSRFEMAIADLKPCVVI